MRSRMWRAVAIGLVALGVGLSGAAAQNKQDKQDDSCKAGPDCVAADQEAQKRIAGWSNLMAGQASTHISSMVRYCTNDAVAQTAKRCQAEFESLASTLKSPMQEKKKQACLSLASQSRQQAEGSDQIAKAALRNAYDSAASSSWRPDCNNIKVPVPHAGKWLFTGGGGTVWTTMDANGIVSGTHTFSHELGTIAVTYQGTANESGISLTTSGTHSNPKVAFYGSKCSGQRSGNGYAGTCSGAYGRTSSFTLMPQ
jgi:hypothetical protein